MKRMACLALALSAAACGPDGNDPGPGGVTVDEARALDRAAEMLEQRRLPPEALSKPAVENAGDSTQTPAPAEPAQQ